MLKIAFLAIILLANISSKKIVPLEFAKETTFDEDNTLFKIDYEGEETSLLVYLTHENKNVNLVLSEDEDGKTGESYDFENPGGARLYRLSEEKSYYLSINTKDKSGLGEGTIWVNPLNREIKVDLSKPIEQKYVLLSEELYGEVKYLNYSVSKLASDKTFTFYLNSEIGDDYLFFNLFWVCHITGKEEECENYVGKYDFKKGENYRISFELQKTKVKEKTFYLLPSYEFREGVDLEFAVETKFDKKNNHFMFKNVGIKGELFAGYIVYIQTENKQLEYVLHTNYDTYENLLYKPGKSILYYTMEDDDEVVIFIKGRGEEGKGTIWVNPLKKEIPIDLSKKYEMKFPVKNDHGIEYVNGSLTYSVSNLKEDKSFTFEFSDKYGDEEIEFYGLKNPFKVCHGKECKEKIKTYDFKKGESYKIYVDFVPYEIEENKFYYFLPSFSFYPTKK